jgi:hypothetical protein
LLSTCEWNSRFHNLLFYESMMILSPVRFQDFILDVKRLLDFAGSDSLFSADVYNGHVVRFVKASALHQLARGLNYGLVVDFCGRIA